MLLKLGMEYMPSGNDKECPDMTQKQTLGHGTSAPKQLSEIPEFEYFVGVINEDENNHNATDD